MEERMTVCNMSIEGGARAGLVAPDENNFSYLKGRKYLPKGEEFEQCVQDWNALPVMKMLYMTKKSLFDGSRFHLWSAGVQIQEWLVEWTVMHPTFAEDIMDSKELESGYWSIWVLEEGMPIMHIPVQQTIFYMILVQTHALKTCDKPQK